MKKTAACLLMIILISAMLGGCWSYQSFSDMSITSGVAVDRDPNTGLYHLTFEIVDLTGPVKEKGVNSRLIESDGETLFDAVRNAKKRIINKLFFGHMKLVILSEDVARNTDMSSLIDFFLRDEECRETIYVAISREPTARDILATYGIGQPMAAYEIQRVIEDDQRITASTAYVEAFEIYNILIGPGIELALPAFHNVVNDEELTSEADGIAVFKGERLVGYLTPQESKGYLFVRNQLHGGVITCSSSSADGPIDTSLEVYDNNTKVSFDNREGQIIISIETDTEAFIDETDHPLNALDPDKIKTIEMNAAQRVMQNIGETIDRVREEYNSDIFGFGNMIYRENPNLWRTIADRWDEIFPALTVNVKCKIKILNTASLKKS